MNNLWLKLGGLFIGIIVISLLLLIPKKQKKQDDLIDNQKFEITIEKDGEETIYYCQNYKYISLNNSILLIDYKEISYTLILLEDSLVIKIRINPYYDPYKINKAQDKNTNFLKKIFLSQLFWLY